MVPTQLVGFTLAFFWLASSGIAGPLTPVNPDAIPDSVGSLPIEFEGNLAELRTALKLQIEVCQNSPSDRWNLGDRSVTRQQYCIKTLSRMANLANSTGSIEELGRKFKRQFSWYKSKGEDRPERLPLLDPSIPFARKSHTEPGVFFTGYHSPHFRGSLTKTARFKFGIYRMPSSSSNRRYSSKQVRAGKLNGKGLELAWLESALDAYLLGIQGSGFIDYQSGSEIKTLPVRYAGSNGQDTRMLSSVLREKKVSEEYTTIPGMRQYYEQHTQELLPDLDLSPNVVFYQETRMGRFTRRILGLSGLYGFKKRFGELQWNPLMVIHNPEVPLARMRIFAALVVSFRPVVQWYKFQPYVQGTQAVATSIGIWLGLIDR